MPGELAKPSAVPKPRTRKAKLPDAASTVMNWVLRTHNGGGKSIPASTPAKRSA